MCFFLQFILDLITRQILAVKNSKTESQVRQKKIFYLRILYWQQIARDNLLWKWLLRRDFRTDIPTLRPGAVCWRDEYERLVDRVPKVRVQSLTLHTDEVLHVAFSHDGNDLVSCSKVSHEHKKKLPMIEYFYSDYSSNRTHSFELNVTSMNLRSDLCLDTHPIFNLELLRTLRF